MLNTIFLYLKAYSGILGGFLLMVGGSIEPSVGIWVVSAGGSLLYLALGPDKRFSGAIFYLFFGICWGVFGSQVIHAISAIPQLAAAFFASMFGSEATWYIMRSFRRGDASSFLLTMVEKVNPFSSVKDDKEGKK